MSATGADNEMEALKILFGRMQDARTLESAQAGYDIKVRESDVFISTALKSGTTWVQQICHQLRSGGDMDFGEINDVAPFLEAAVDVGQSLEDEQKYEPRLFKTHFWEPDTPKGARYIVVARHPYDTAVSFFHFVEDWMFAKGEISLATFTREVFMRFGEPRSLLEFPSVFHHFASWWPRRHDKTVLHLFYEDLRDDLEGQIRRVASFLGVTDPQVIAQTVEKAGFAYMKSHEGKFDENRFKLQRNELCGVPKDAGKAVTKVRVGGGQRHLLPDDMKAAIDAQWKKVCEPVISAASYDEWLENWRKGQKSNCRYCSP